MAKTKQEIEEWLKVFYRRQKERQIEDEVWDEEDRGSEKYEFFVRSCYENNFTIYIPQAIVDLMPDWDWDWEYCDWIMDTSSGIGLLGIEGAQFADEDAKEQYGVDSVDDLSRYNRIDLPKYETSFCQSHISKFDDIFTKLISNNPANLYNISGHLNGIFNLNPPFGRIVYD